jgi:hypothetical protein
MNAPTDDPGAELRRLLAAAGLEPPEDEAAMLEALYPLLRAGADAIYDVDVDDVP